MRIALTVTALSIFLAWSTVMYAWVDERQQRHRRRTITALTAHRRRIDRELDNIRAELGLIPYEPEPPWTPAEHATPAPDEQPPPRVQVITVEDTDPDPATVPIRLPAPDHPATAPAAAVIDAGLADIDRQYRAALAALDQIATEGGK